MFNQPLYVIFRNLCLTPDSDGTRQLLLSLIAEMCERCVFDNFCLLIKVPFSRIITDTFSGALNAFNTLEHTPS